MMGGDPVPDPQDRHKNLTRERKFSERMIRAMLSRQSPRLKNFNYTVPGGYFVTICTHQRMSILGEIQDFNMVLNDAGRIAELTWDAMAARFDNLTLDARVIMPNHIHGLLFITEQKKRGLNQFIAWYKYQTTVLINRLWGASGQSVWQRSYYDHIIRPSEDIAKYREYILGNPAKWAEDEYNRI